MDLFRDTIKSDGRNVTGADTSNFAKKVNLTSLKSDVDKIENDKLKTIATDLSKLNNAADDDVEKKTVYGKLAKKLYYWSYWCKKISLKSWQWHKNQGNCKENT